MQPHLLALHYLERTAHDGVQQFVAYALIRRGASEYDVDMIRGRVGAGTHHRAWRSGSAPAELSAMISAEVTSKKVSTGFAPAIPPPRLLDRLPPYGFGMPQPPGPTSVDLKRFRNALTLPGHVAVRNPAGPRVVVSFPRPGEPAVLTASEAAAMTVGADLVENLERYGLVSPFGAETRLLVTVDPRSNGGHQVDVLDCLMYEGRPLTEHPYAERSVLAGQALTELHDAGTWALSIWDIVTPLSRFVAADAARLAAPEAAHYAVRSLEADLDTPNGWLTIDPAG